jgi:hypothetical protein
MRHHDGQKFRHFAPLPTNLSLEELVPKDNFYRRLDRELDLSFVRYLVKECYASSGRPSVDPVVFFRLQLVMFFEDIRGKRNGADRDGKVTFYRARASECAVCQLRPQCTSNKNGRQLRRDPKERYAERVRAYRGTALYEKALRKRKVWVEPLFAEAKDWHGMRRFRFRRLEKVNIEALLIASGQRTPSGCSTSEAGDRRS